MFNCSCAISEAVASEANTTQEQKNWESKPGVPCALPCPTGATANPAVGFTATFSKVFRNLGDRFKTTESWKI